MVNYHADSAFVLNAIGQGNFFKFLAFNAVSITKFVYQFSHLPFHSSVFVEKMLKEPGLFCYKAFIVLICINAFKHVSLQLISVV